jgi:hypothetical protein
MQSHTIKLLKLLLLPLPFIAKNMPAELAQTHPLLWLNSKSRNRHQVCQCSTTSLSQGSSTRLLIQHQPNP